MLRLWIIYKARAEVFKAQGLGIQVDNALAEQCQIHVGALAPPAHTHHLAVLCRSCADLDVWTGGFTFPEKMSNVLRSTATFDLCSLLDSVRRRART
jgi:hypothetical protein